MSDQAGVVFNVGATNSEFADVFCYFTMVFRSDVACCMLHVGSGAGIATVPCNVVVLTSARLSPNSPIFCNETVYPSFLSTRRRQVVGDRWLQVTMQHNGRGDSRNSKQQVDLGLARVATFRFSVLLQWRWWCVQVDKVVNTSLIWD